MYGTFIPLPLESLGALPLGAQLASRGLSEQAKCLRFFRFGIKRGHQPPSYPECRKGTPNCSILDLQESAWAQSLRGISGLHETISSSTTEPTPKKRRSQRQFAMLENEIKIKNQFLRNITNLQLEPVGIQAPQRSALTQMQLGEWTINRQDWDGYSAIMRGTSSLRDQARQRTSYRL